MIEFFLSHPTCLSIIFIILFCLSVLWLAAIALSYVTNEIDRKENLKEYIRTYIFYPIPAILTLIAITTISINVEQHPTYTEWKQLYTNEQNINILLTDYSDPAERTSDYRVNKAGEKLGRFSDSIQDEFQGINGKEWTGYVVATTDGQELSKYVHLSKDNIEGELTPESKITKIEYREMTKIYYSLWGHNGNEQEVETPREIRITVNTSDEAKAKAKDKLNKLFQTKE